MRRRSRAAAQAGLVLFVLSPLLPLPEAALAQAVDRVSVATGGTEGDAGTDNYTRPAVSAAGRFVAFVSGTATPFTELTFP